MPFKKFYYQDSHNDHEVSFLLELTSILQTEFNYQSILSVSTSRNIDHLLNQYEWTSKPQINEREISHDECWINLSGRSLNSDMQKHFENGHALLVSTESNVAGNEVGRISSHMLKSPIIYPEITTSMAWSVAKAIVQKDFYKNAPQKIITIVSTNEVNEWISLIEAAATIISYWYRYQDADTRVELLDLSKGIQKSQATKVALTSDCLVLVKISPTTAQFIKLTRNINPDCKMIIHGFESASVYFANTYLYGIEEYLYQQDLWVMSCKADAELAKLSWKNIKTTIVPLRSPYLHKKEIKIKSERSHIYFFGRISEQKNIEASLFAISILASQMRKEKRKFKIYGYEDYLGVPNLRIPSQGYLENLYANVKKLGIKDLVEFHPTVAVEAIESELKNGIFLSPSVHSDENFGLVAYRALKTGTPVILSKWGGHNDLSGYFSGIEYVDVFETKSGSEVNPYQIAKILLKVWQNNPQINEIKMPFEKLSLEWSGKDKLESTDVKLEVVKKVEDTFPWPVRKWPLYGKIFSNHMDPNYLMAQRIYGARKLTVNRTNSEILSPLVNIDEKEIKIKDPKSGVLCFPRQGKQDLELKQLGTNKIFHLSTPESNWLWENGYIYSKEEL